MSTAVLPMPLARPGAATPPSLARLTAVELRKMTDTRAGFWLQLAVAGLTVAVVVLVGIFGEPADHTFKNMLLLAITPATVLLPIIGILLVTSEWSQRTAMVTFALVPQRMRIMAAKLLASVVLSLAVLALCIAIAALGTAITGPAVEGAWSLPAGVLGQVIVYMATGMLTGVAVGALLLSSAPAIVLYFVAPLAWAALASFSFLEWGARWLDGTRTLEPMVDHIMSATEWARVGTTLALWLLLPLLIGLWRINRGEVR